MMSVDVKVQGHCPMGCGETLQLNGDGKVFCAYYNEETDEECPDFWAVDKILASGETRHVVDIGHTNFSVKHPLRERVADELFRCDIHERLSALPSPPVLPGLYLVDDDLNFTTKLED